MNQQMSPFVATLQSEIKHLRDELTQAQLERDMLRGEVGQWIEVAFGMKAAAQRFVDLVESKLK